jgi:hypothetical protein
MALEPDFQKKLEGKPDQDLLAILAQESSYLPEALAAVRAELAHRNVDFVPPRPAPPAPLLSAVDLPKLPPIWIGFGLAGGCLVVEIFQAALGRGNGLRPLALTISIATWIYWLFCVSRFHAVVNGLADPDPSSPSGTSYPISPPAAVGRHFIPLYNFYWACAWPAEMQRFLTAHSSIQMASETWLGLGLLLSLVLRFLDSFLGYCLLFAVGAYIAAKLRQAVRERVARDSIPEAFA